jgi:hypothetical protein
MLGQFRFRTANRLKKDCLLSSFRHARFQHLQARHQQNRDLLISIQGLDTRRHGFVSHEFLFDKTFTTQNVSPVSPSQQLEHKRCSELIPSWVKVCKSNRMNNLEKEGVARAWIWRPSSSWLAIAIIRRIALSLLVSIVKGRLFRCCCFQLRHSKNLGGSGCPKIQQGKV